MPKRDILFRPVGTTGSAGRCPCWVASQEQGLTKSFLVQGRKTCHEITGQQGKRRLFAVALAAFAVPTLAKPKECDHVGRRLLRWGCETRRKSLESRILDGSLDSISIYFLRYNTTCRPQSRAGRCIEKMVL